MRQFQIPNRNFNRSVIYDKKPDLLTNQTFEIGVTDAVYEAERLKIKSSNITIKDLKYNDSDIILKSEKEPQKQKKNFIKITFVKNRIL